MQLPQRCVSVSAYRLTRIGNKDVYLRLACCQLLRQALSLMHEGQVSYQQLDTAGQAGRADVTSMQGGAGWRGERCGDGGGASAEGIRCERAISNVVV